MASVNFGPIAGSQKYIQKNDANYFTAQGAAIGDDTGGSIIGQFYQVTPDYGIWRLAMSFDTSGLDDSALIESATLYIYASLAQQTIDRAFDIIIKSGMPTYPHVAPEVGDYDIDHYSGNGGEIAAAYEDMTFTLNATGLGWINKTGNTKFMLISSRDVGALAPTGEEYAHIDASTHPPLLTVVYYVPSAIPVVGDPTFSNTKATYTKATANVSDVGGGYEERGFEYGTSEVATWAVRETGVWGATGSYSLILPNLLPLTTYYARAYATNDYGVGYSDWTSFTTTDVPTYGLYEEDNTATICFYISEDDGKTWGQKHGPYTTDQADIEITKLLVRGSGKKKIKFESNVLTGISASVMVKLDLKAR